MVFERADRLDAISSRYLLHNMLLWRNADFAFEYMHFYSYYFRINGDRLVARVQSDC